MKRLLSGTLLLALAGAAAAADQVNVAIGQRGLWDTMVTIQGIEEGFFAEEDLEVDVTWTQGGSETLQAAMTGSVDFAMANGILGVLSAYAKGAPVRIVSAESTGAADLFWYAPTASDIQTMEDTGGRTTGFSRPGSSTHLVVLALANHYGVEPELVPTGGISGTRTQVMSGQIDVGWSVPPFNLDLVRNGEIRIVARGSEVPGIDEQTVRVNVANADFLEQRRDVAERFMRAYAKTIDWMYDNPEEALARYAEFNEVDMDVAKAALEFYPKSALAMGPIAGMDENMAQAVEYERLEQPLSEDQVNELVQLLGQ